MCLEAVDIRGKDKANGTLIVPQLTPMVNKDVLLVCFGVLQ